MSADISPRVAAAIDENFVFKTLEEEARLRLKQAGRMRAFLPGQTIIKEGAEAEEMYLIILGKAEVATELEDEGKVELAELGPGALLGEVAVVTGMARTSTVKAVETVEVVILPAELVREIIETHPKVRDLLLRIVHGRAMDTAAKVLK